MTTINAASDALYSKLWRTRGARFISRDRYLCMSLLSVSCISILSVYVIALSVIGIVFQKDFTDMGSNVLNALNVSISVAILAFSLIEGSRNHLGKSDTMNDCALAIGRIYDEFSLQYRFGTVTLDVLEATTKRYSDILDKYRLNHSLSDYEKFLPQHPDPSIRRPFLFFLIRPWKSAIWWFQTIWIYTVGAISPPLIIFGLCYAFWGKLIR